MHKIIKASKKGFTLLEMIVIVGIIAILSGILIPTVSGYITRSRIASANGSARVLFNSLQTVLQELEFSERTAQSSELYGAKKHGTIYIEAHPNSSQTDGFLITQFVAEDSTGAAQTVSDDIIGTQASDRDAHPASIGARLNRLYSDLNTTVWAAYITDYSVNGVVAGSSEHARYVGGFPVAATERGKLTVDGTTYTFNALGSTINSSNVIDYAIAAYN